MSIRDRLRRAGFFFLPLLAPSILAAGQSEDSKDSADYIRFVPAGKDGGRLETSIVTFEGPKGLKVHLVAAVHIGDGKYYRELSGLFDGYDALLFELVRQEGDLPKPGETGGGIVGALQRAMKDLLALEFQLDAIDYTRSNFIHADMDAATFERLSRERGENLFTLMLRVIIEDLKKQSEGKGQAQINAFDLLKVLLSRDRARSLKLLLGRQFKDIEEKLSAFEGEKSSVILTERNKVAVEVLKKTVAAGKKNIGIFYGGAHMPDMERRIREDLKLKPISTRWLTAWDIPPLLERKEEETPKEAPKEGDGDKR